MLLRIHDIEWDEEEASPWRGFLEEDSYI